jgi:hypothetical protein
VSENHILIGFAHQVLSEFVQKGDMSERQAIDVTKKALFENANRVYNLGLEPAVGGTVCGFKEPMRKSKR